MVKRNGKKTHGKWQKDIHACRFLGAHSLFIRSIIYKPANNNRALWKRPLLAQEAANDSGVQTKCSILSASPTYTHTIMATTTKKEKERKKRLRKWIAFEWAWVWAYYLLHIRCTRTFHFDLIIGKMENLVDVIKYLADSVLTPNWIICIVFGEPFAIMWCHKRINIK